ALRELGGGDYHRCAGVERHRYAFDACEASDECRACPTVVGISPVGLPSITVGTPATTVARKPALGRENRQPPSGRSCTRLGVLMSISSRANTARSARRPTSITP